MAYTLHSDPPSIDYTTTTEAYVELTLWEEIKLWLNDETNIAFYILIPSLTTLYGSFILVYIIHRIHRFCKRARRRRRRQEKLADLEKRPMLDDVDSVSAYDVCRISGPVSLTYDNTATPNETNLYPIESKDTLHPPRPKVAAKQGTIRKMTQISSKPRTQIIIRCNCAGSMHQPGCSRFKVPELRLTSAMSVDKGAKLSSNLQDAMERVAVYEHELKTNPLVRQQLEKYRERRRENTQKTWEEEARKGNWQSVPIAQLLVRKKQMKESRSATAMN